MKSCAQCGSEYQDGVKECSDCGSSTFVPGAPPAPVAEIHQRDTRRFVSAGVAEDPLSSARFVELLTEKEIPVFARPRRGGTVDALSSAALPWWEILVPEEHAPRAAALIADERVKIEAESEDAAKAAEEEEAAGEIKPVE